MLGLGKTGAAGILATASPDRRRDIYQGHAAALYGQALLMLDDPALAENVVFDAIVEECARIPAQRRGEDETRYRLAQSVFRRCRQSAAGLTRQPTPRPSGTIDPGGLLNEKERGALGLVLFGGLEYVRASTVLGIGSHDTATLLRTALRRLQISSVAAGG